MSFAQGLGSLLLGSSVGQGIAGSQAASYQAQVAKNNSIIAKQNATYSAEAGSAQTEEQGLKSASKSGLVRAAFASNGLDVNTGSAADVQTSQRELGYLDTATTASNAALQTYGYNTQSQNYKAQEELENQEAIDAPIEGLLNGASKLSENYQWMAG